MTEGWTYFSHFIFFTLFFKTGEGHNLDWCFGTNCRLVLLRRAGGCWFVSPFFFLTAGEWMTLECFVTAKPIQLPSLFLSSASTLDLLHVALSTISFWWNGLFSRSQEEAELCFTDVLSGKQWKRKDLGRHKSCTCWLFQLVHLLCGLPTVLLYQSHPLSGASVYYIFHFKPGCSVWKMHSWSVPCSTDHG